MGTLGGGWAPGPSLLPAIFLIIGQLPTWQFWTPVSHLILLFGHLTSSGTLVPWPEIGSRASALRGQSLNHWTAMEFQFPFFNIEILTPVCPLHGGGTQDIMAPRTLMSVLSVHNWPFQLPHQNMNTVLCLFSSCGLYKKMHTLHGLDYLCVCVVYTHSHSKHSFITMFVLVFTNLETNIGLFAWSNLERGGKVYFFGSCCLVPGLYKAWGAEQFTVGRMVACIRMEYVIRRAVLARGDEVKPS